jgi:integrase
MNRARKTNRGLPRRVYLKHGAYRFFSPTPIRDAKTGKMKKWHHLAYEHEGQDAIYDPLGRLLGDKSNDKNTMPYVCAEFKNQKLKKYSDEVRKQYSQYLDVIADDFEDFLFAQVTTKNWADFLRNNFRDKQNTAQKYTALARKLFKYGISELGLRQDNPIDQIDLGDYETQRREKLPTHEQIAAIRAAGMESKPRKDSGKTLPTASGPMFTCIIDMTYLLWQRAIDIRMLKEEQIHNGHIRFKPSKTRKSSGKMVDILITPAIQAVIDRARAIKKTYKVHGHDLITPYLFPTQKGTPYTKSGLVSMWKRAKKRAKITDDVQFKDLRALGATDAAKAKIDKKEIQKRLVHTSGDTTDIYIKEAVPETSGIDLALPWKTPESV